MIKGNEKSQAIETRGKVGIFKKAGSRLRGAFRVKSILTGLVCAAVSVLSIHVSAQTAGDVLNNVSGSGTGAANLINTFALVGGALSFVAGVFFVNNENFKNKNGGAGKAWGMIIVGIILVSWQGFVRIGGNTLDEGQTQQFLNDN